MLLFKMSIMNKDKRTIFQENVFCINMYMNLQMIFQWITQPENYSQLNYDMSTLLAITVSKYKKPSWNW